ncbi:MAG TPA: hypothetical protein VFV34_13255 [Blastocatellia bacterium]|nr:hypothetical protein [Blastocatellia bacterium]
MIRISQRPEVSASGVVRHLSSFIVVTRNGLLLAILCSCGDVLAFDLREPSSIPNRASDLWLFLPIGYLFTIAIETPVLVLGLSRHITLKQRFFAGLWLTACTYPIVILVLPMIFGRYERGTYLLVAETFAPVAECGLFWLAFRSKLPPGAKTLVRNFVVIVVANLLSFGAGELMSAIGWLGLY